MSAPGVHTQLPFFLVASVLEAPSTAFGLFAMPPLSSLSPLCCRPGGGLKCLESPRCLHCLHGLQCLTCPHCLGSQSRLPGPSRVSRGPCLSTVSYNGPALQRLHCRGPLSCRTSLWFWQEAPVSTLPRMSKVSAVSAAFYLLTLSSAWCVPRASGLPNVSTVSAVSGRPSLSTAVAVFRLSTVSALQTVSTIAKVSSLS